MVAFDEFREDEEAMADMVKAKILVTEGEREDRCHDGRSEVHLGYVLPRR